MFFVYRVFSAYASTQHHHNKATSSRIIHIGYSQHMLRLFVAVWPPSEVQHNLGELFRQIPNSDAFHWATPSSFHITLRFLGETDKELAASALSGFSFPKTQVLLKPTVEKLGYNALVIPVEGSDKLADAVLTASSHIGQPPKSPYVGHLTVARFKKRAHDSRSSDLLAPMIENVANAANTVAFADFMIAEITLVEVKRNGAYESVERFPLA